jgi:hypothetical protein
MVQGHPLEQALAQIFQAHEQAQPRTSILRYVSVRPRARDLPLRPLNAPPEVTGCSGAVERLRPGSGRNDLDRAVKWKEGAANSVRIRRGGGVGVLTGPKIWRKTISVSWRSLWKNSPKPPMIHWMLSSPCCRRISRSGKSDIRKPTRFFCTMITTLTNSGPFAAAQKARWAKVKAAKPAKAGVKAPAKRKAMSAAAKAKISAAAKKRWAKAKAAGKNTL